MGRVLRIILQEVAENVSLKGSLKKDPHPALARRLRWARDPNPGREKYPIEVEKEYINRSWNGFTQKDEYGQEEDEPQGRPAGGRGC
jgi:hypothetical protein